MTNKMPTKPGKCPFWACPKNGPKYNTGPNTNDPKNQKI